MSSRSRSTSTSQIASRQKKLLFFRDGRRMRTLALLDESREEYERRRVLIAQRVAEGSQLLSPESGRRTRGCGCGVCAQLSSVKILT